MDKAKVKLVATEWDIEDDLAVAIVDLADQRGLDIENIENIEERGYRNEDAQVEIDGEEYSIYLDSDDARKDAIEYNIELIDEIGVQSVNGWENFIDETRAKRFFTQVYDEWNYSYCEDIMNEGPSRRNSDYPSRFAEECVERRICDEDEVLADDWDGYDYIDDFVEDMTKDQIDEGNGGYDYYASNFGDEEAAKILVDEGLIDVEELAEYIIDSDGMGPSMASYDGEETDVGKDGIAFRVN